MKRIELYSLEDINSYLQGAKYIKYSNLIEAKGIIPIGAGKVRVVASGLINYKNGYNATRRELRNFMPGCDIYYEIKDVPETAQMRHELSQGKVTVLVDEKGYGEIEDKKYFFLTDIPDQIIAKLKGKVVLDNDNTAYVVENEEDYAISFTKPSEQDALFATKGYLISVSDIKRIQELGLGNFLLDDNHFSTYVQNGTTITKTTLEENLDTTYVYSPNDEVEVVPDSLPKEKIVTFYEYDPATERPGFGEVYELSNIGTDANGEIIWCKTPKIIQNEHNSEYANRADAKRVRTVIQIPDNELETILPMLEAEGKSGAVVEFAVTEMGEDFLTEKGVVKKKETTFHI